MWEKFNQIAEHAAIDVSRRQFLGRVGRGALMAAGALGALMVFPSDALAGRRCPEGYHYCRHCGCIGNGTRCQCDPR